MYEIITGEIAGEIFETICRKNDDGTESTIPKDEANADYQAYLKWLEENN